MPTQKTKTQPTKSGSILAFSMIILAMMLTVAVGIASVEMVQKKNASSTQFSVQSYQVADGGSQLALKKINVAVTDPLITNKKEWRRWQTIYGYADNN